MTMCKILIIDDSPAVCKSISMLLEDEDYETLTANNGEDGIILAREQNPDLILLDISLPEISGFDVCKILKQDNRMVNVPILFITGHYYSSNYVVKGLELGAYDFIRKPFDTNELLARIRVMLRIKQQQDKITELSLTDVLTGIYNRRMLMYRGKDYFSIAERRSLPLTCVLLDIDNFKEINDHFGHPFGDFVLKEVAGILKKFSRSEDLLIRYGGEEFLFLTHDSPQEAYNMAERLRKSVEEHPFENKKNSTKLTISIGIGQMLECVTDTEERLIALADCALYYAKFSGKNKVISFPDDGIPLRKEDISIPIL